MLINDEQTVLIENVILTIELTVIVFYILNRANEIKNDRKLTKKGKFFLAVCD